jgi:hypothetical protein
VAAGAVSDPRRGGSGLVRLRLPRVAGRLAIWDRAAAGGALLGEVDFSPAILGSSEARQDDAFVGSPVLLVDHGDTAPMMNLLFLAEGYRNEELDRFHNDVWAETTALAGRPDYAPYWPRFNVASWDVVSNDSGVSDEDVLLDTAFNVTIVPGLSNGLDFSAEAGQRRAYEVMAQTGATVVILLVNSDHEAGSGLQGLVLLTRGVVPGKLAHELGHAAFGLADEYAEASLVDGCADDADYPNAARAPDRGSLPWGYLVLDETPLPTPDSDDYDFSVGAFEGANYCPTGWYRARRTCLMRDGWSPLCEGCLLAISGMIGNP